MATITVGAVVGVVTTIGGIALKVVITVAKVLFTITKIFYQIAFTIFKLFFIFVSFLVNGLLSGVVPQIKRYFDMILGGGIRQRKFKFTKIDEFIFFFNVVFQEFIRLLRAAFIPFLVFLVIIAFLSVGIGITFLLGYLIGITAPIIFNVIYVITMIGQIIAEIVVIILNLLMETIEVFAPVYNDTWDILKNVLIQFVALICNFNVGEPFKCVPLKDAINWVSDRFTAIIWFFNGLGNIIILNFIALKDVSGCTDNVCPPDLCTQIFKIPNCSYTPQIFISILGQIFQFFISYILPVFQVLFYFFLDLVIFFLKQISGIVAFLSSPDTFTQFIRFRVGTTISLVSERAPEGVFKQAFILLENFLLNSVGTAIDTIKKIIEMVDYFVCNIFLDWRACLVKKLCFFMIPPTIPLTIPIINVKIFIPMAQIICVNTLHLDGYTCNCENCVSTSPVSVIFQYLGLLTNGKFMVPCNGDFYGCPSCSSSTYSITRYISPI